MKTTSFQTTTYSGNVLYWHKYSCVDDVLCIWRGDDHILQNFIASLTFFRPKLQFTYEMGGTRINFLDLQISGEENDDSISSSFDIYWKSTYTGVTINGKSSNYYFQQQSTHKRPKTSLPEKVIFNLKWCFTLSQEKPLQKKTKHVGPPSILSTFYSYTVRNLRKFEL